MPINGDIAAPALSRGRLLIRRPVEETPGIVAIVEDDASMCRSIMRLLNAHGFTTEVFSSAEAFLNRGSDSCVTCLVLDIHLKGMSGIELRYHLKDLGSKVPVIFITAVDDDTLKREAVTAGCVAYLHKPFPAELLTSAVNRAFGSPHLTM